AEPFAEMRNLHIRTGDFPNLAFRQHGRSASAVQFHNRLTKDFSSHNASIQNLVNIVAETGTTTRRFIRSYLTIRLGIRHVPEPRPPLDDDRHATGAEDAIALN